MTATIIVQGRVSEPRTNTTRTGKTVTSFGIAATPRTKNTDTGEWADDGAPLWIEVSFWDRDAERVATIRKGDMVAVQGILKMEEYRGRDGRTGTKLTVKQPRFLGVAPSAGSQNRAEDARTGGWQGGSSFDDTPPF